MNEEKLNMSLRKFLKNVGINSQRLIEDKVREAVKSGQINDSQNEMLFTPVLGGKHKGEIVGSVVTLENHFKVFEKDLKKYLKLEI